MVGISSRMGSSAAGCGALCELEGGRPGVGSLVALARWRSARGAPDEDQG